MAPCAALLTRIYAMLMSAIFPQTSEIPIRSRYLMSVQVIKNKTMTPDFSSNGVVLYHWSQDVDS